MPNFLGLVNALRGKLRSGDVLAAFPTTNTEQADEEKRLINEAARDVLESRVWSFDKRFDGRQMFKAAFSGTDADVGGNSEWSIEGVITTISANMGINTLTAEQSASSIRVGASEFWPIVDVSSDGSDPLNRTDVTVGNTFTFVNADPTNNAWTIINNEVALPATVREVLAVMDMAQPLQLTFESREFFTNPFHSDPVQYLSGDPYVVNVGGTVSNTDVSTDPGVGGSQRTGTSMSIWPAPDADVVINFTYVYRHPTLSATTDTLAGVPETIQDIIIWRAAQMAWSSIRQDPNMALAAERIIAVKSATAIDMDRRGRNRRRVPTTFGSSRSGRPPRSGWATQLIPDP